VTLQFRGKDAANGAARHEGLESGGGVRARDARRVVKVATNSKTAGIAEGYISKDGAYIFYRLGGKGFLGRGVGTRLYGSKIVSKEKEGCRDT